MYRKIIASFLIFWLSLQGTIVFAQPVCAHTNKPGNEQISKSVQKDACDHHKAPDNASHGQEKTCDHCGYCYLSGSAVFPAPAVTHLKLAQEAAIPPISTAERFHSAFSDQPYRPPRS